MPFFLEIDSGPRRGERIALPPGTPVSVGRTARADVAVAEDSFLSGRHFEVEAGDAACTLRDLHSSNGTVFQGAPVSAVQLHAGSAFVAGRTRFLLLHEAESEPAAAPAEPEPLLPSCRERLLEHLRSAPQPLYAVLDAAHDPRILGLLVQSKSQYVWLFEQGTPPELLGFAPYLVPLPAGSPMLEVLVDMGWAAHWGIYLTSAAGAWDLLAFLRRLLLADQPDGQRALLRFYDPRVLRTLLTKSVPGQWPYLFGTVQSYLLPGEEPQTAESFSRSQAGVERLTLFLDGSAPAGRDAVQGAPPQPGRDGPRTQAADRMVLTAEQMAAFRAKQKDPLPEALLAEVRERFPERLASLGEDTLREWVRHGCERPRRYGIQADGDIGSYVSLMMQLGRNFDTDPALPWAGDLLRLRLDPAEKLARLLAAAAEHASVGAQ